MVRQDRACGTSMLSGVVLRGLFVDVGDDDPCAQARKLLAKGAANARGAASHKSHFA